MTTQVARTKPNNIIEARQQLRPAFRLAEILSSFGRELSQSALDADDSDYIFEDPSKDDHPALSSVPSTNSGRTWQPEGSHPHVTELREHYMQNQTRMLDLYAAVEAQEPDVDSERDIDEVTQGRWNVRDRVRQVGKTWATARAIREAQVRETTNGSQKAK